jgi:hypothetical protein
MNHQTATVIARQMTHHVPDVLEENLVLDIANQKWHHVAATIARAVCAKFEPGQKTRRSEPWEPLDPKAPMFGIFDANGASAEPIAIFRERKLAEDYLAWDKSRGDNREIWCESCIMSIKRLEGECWNSLENPEAPPSTRSVKQP